AQVKPAEMTRPLVAQDVQFYDALATARLALTGGGAIAEAGKKILAFEKAYPDSSHYFEACGVVGDVLVGMGNFPIADTYYAKLAAAPWPEYKLRAAVLSGKALVGQKKYDEAIARFDAVEQAKLTGKVADAQRVAAQLGKALALSGAGQH